MIMMPMMMMRNPSHFTPQWLSLSGCEALTDSALLTLAPLAHNLKYFDCSGCFRSVCCCC